MSDDFICFNDECHNKRYIKEFKFNNDKKQINIVVKNTEIPESDCHRNDINKSFSFINDESQYNSIRNKIRGSK